MGIMDTGLCGLSWEPNRTQEAYGIKWATKLEYIPAKRLG
jgi:hypothetical protein